MINDNVLKGQWKVIKGEALKVWGKLTNDELDQTAGKAEQMEGLLQRKMGFKQDEAKTEVRNFLSRFTKDEDGTSKEIPSIKNPDNRPFQDVKLEEESGIDLRRDKF